MKPDNVLSLLGMAAKAGAVSSGEFAAERAVKKGKARLLLVAEDASDNTKKQFKDMADYYGVPMYLYGSKETLGHSIGREYRASLAVENEGLARSIEKRLAAGHDAD